MFLLIIFCCLEGFFCIRISWKKKLKNVGCWVAIPRTSKPSLTSDALSQWLTNPILMALEWESDKPNSSTLLFFSPWYWKAKLLPALAPHVRKRTLNWKCSGYLARFTMCGFRNFCFRTENSPDWPKKPRFFRFIEHLIFLTSSNEDENNLWN